MSQTARILLDMSKGKTITPIDALKLYGCFRLASRINEIKGMGYEVKKEMVSSKGKRYARYWI